MATNNEIEFKQILTKDLYDKIFNTYFKNEKPFSQTNYYIDTKGFKLRDHRSALRIRVKDNSYEPPVNKRVSSIFTPKVALPVLFE